MQPRRAAPVRFGLTTPPAPMRFAPGRREPTFPGPSLSRHDHLADRPERDAGELQMGPGEGDADDCDRQHQCGFK